MRTLRVVLVMLEPPLPFGHASARWYHVLLSGLVNRGHEVAAFTACSKPEEIEKVRDLFPAPGCDLHCYGHPLRRGLAAKWETLRRPYSYMFASELLRDLRRRLALGFDILHLEQLWAGWVGLSYADRSLINIHNLMWVDLEHQPRPSWQAIVHDKLMFSAERRLVRRFRYFRSCSPRLVPEILRVNPRARVATVPLGLDSALYPYIEDERRIGAPVVSVIGSMSWYPSLSAAERFLTRLWPEIKTRVPTARAQIVGWNARSALAGFLGMPDVSIHENVSDIRPYFENTSVLLYAPARGSGMKIKVLEAMAFGVPVVTTSEGIEGLPVQDGVHAGVCEDDAGLVERAVKLLMDRVAQNRQRAAGRALIETYCGPRTTLDQVEQIYAAMLGSRQ